MGYFILPVNNIPVSAEDNIDAITIIKRLFKEEIWPFREGSPNLTKLQINDILLIYVCGNGRRYFYGEAEIRSKYKPFNENITSITKELGVVWMSAFIDIKPLRTFEPPIKIQPLIASLNFIKDKKNYGLHLRLPIVRITEDDYKLIIGVSRQDIQQ